MAVTSVLENTIGQIRGIARLRAESEQAELAAELLELQTRVSIAENESTLNPLSEQEEEIALIDADTLLLKAKIAQLEAEQLLLELQSEE